MSTPRQYRDNEMVVNYQDAVIYGADLRLVQSPTGWLNDACILFFLTILQQEEDPGKKRNVFMDPSVVSFFMHQCIEQDEIEDFVAGFTVPSPPAADGKVGKILIPINDTMAVNSRSWQQPGCGNHWSLLVVTLAQGREKCEECDSGKNKQKGCTNDNRTVSYWHFDSIRGSNNSSAAQNVAHKLNLHVFHKEQPGNKAMEPPLVLSACTVQQTNGYDCGIHVLAAAQQLAPLVSENLSDYETKLDEYAKAIPSFCEALRTTIVNDMLRLAGDATTK